MTVKKQNILRITPQGITKIEDDLIMEETYVLVKNGEVIRRFHCTPSDLPQLAIGYCYDKAGLRDISQVTGVHVSEEHKCIEIEISAAPDSPVAPKRQLLQGKAPQPHEHYDFSAIYRLYEQFVSLSTLYIQTGAAHSCALADNGQIILFKEDVARHNALDKMIGEMLCQGIDPTGKMLIFSGRLAGDMLKKVEKTDIKLLISPGAPTATAVERAEQADITILGFIHANRANLYSHWDRISNS